MKKTATTSDPEEEFSAAEAAKFQRWLDAKETQRIAAEREKLGLTTAASCRRNETRAPLTSRGCTSDALDIEKTIKCDGRDPFCRRGAIVAPIETFIYPAGHRVAALTAEMPEVDEAIAASEGTFQARTALVKLRETLKQVEEAAAKATWNLNDKREQRKIIDEAIAQQEQECARRSAHVDAAQRGMRGVSLAKWYFARKGIPKMCG